MRNKLILLFTFVLLASPAWGATQLKKTVKPSGGDYTSLESCMNANEQDLVTADKYFDVEIDGTWSSADTTAVTIHNYTTDATRYINIYTTGDARHAGKIESGKYVLSVTAAEWPNGVTSITVGNNNVIIDGLIIKPSGVNNAATTVVAGYPFEGFVFKNNIIFSGGWGLLNISSWASNVYVFNNILIQPTNDLRNDPALYVSVNDTGNVYLYSNTVYTQTNGGTYGIKSNNANTIAKNNLVIGGSSGCWNGTFKNTSTNNLASDTTTPEYNTYYDSKTVAFVDVTNGDAHLLSTDTDAIDTGASTSGESAPLNFTTDIDGTTRSGTWDIGADEYSVSTSGQVIIMGGS
jgi:hypothetical protein